MTSPDFGLPSETDNSSNAWRRAALIGDLAVVKSLLKRGVNVDARDSFDRTALIEAAFGRQIQMVEFLISQGADLNARDRDGWTALMEAASKGHLEIVRILLAEGADVNLQSNDGLTVFDITAKGHSKILNLLRAASGSTI